MEELHGLARRTFAFSKGAKERRLIEDEDSPNQPLHQPQWAEVDIAGLSIENVREFVQAYLALALWHRLELHTLLRELIEPGKERVPWGLTACVLTIARFCGNKSELEVAERWYQDSALEDILGVGWERINDSGLDVFHEHKDALCKHLMERYGSLFGVEFEFLLYAVTSTYFEGQAETGQYWCGILCSVINFYELTVI